MDAVPNDLLFPLTKRHAESQRKSRHCPQFGILDGETVPPGTFRVAFLDSGKPRERLDRRCRDSLKLCFARLALTPLSGLGSLYSISNPPKGGRSWLK